jgi:AcrR family transcriptional regulator
MQSRKQELLDALIAYLQRHGLADLSLRPMAAATGTSARLLIFHFRSKERLLAEVLEEMQARLQRSFVQMSEQSGEIRGPMLRVFWDWALKPENFAYLKLLYQLHILAAQAPKTYGRYLKGNSTNWLELIQAAMPPERRDPVLVTLIVAVFDGLFIELMSTGDRRRTTQAIDRFIEMAARPAKPIKPPRRK